MVLFSGDGDFRSLIEAVQRRGVRVTVISTISTQPPMVADELRRQADVFTDIVTATSAARPRSVRAAGPRPDARAARRAPAHAAIPAARTGADPGRGRRRGRFRGLIGRLCCPHNRGHGCRKRQTGPQLSRCPRLVARSAGRGANVTVMVQRAGALVRRADGAVADRRPVHRSPRGANRTGRPFTGDWAGDLLYATLKEYGFARGDYDERPDDTLELVDARITNGVRCVRRARQSTAEVNTCRDFLGPTIAEMPKLRAIRNSARPHRARDHGEGAPAPGARRRRSATAAR